MDTAMWEHGQSHTFPQHPKMTPFPVLTYFCFSASFLCSKVSAHSPLPSTLESGGSAAAASPAAGDVPSLRSAGGTHFTQLRRGQQRWPLGTTGQVPALRTPLHVLGMLRGMWGDPVGGQHCHPHPTGQPASEGTFGADELQVLLPGAADVLQGSRFRLEALELLQPVLQAPGSLQHRSRVCRTQDIAVSGRDTRHQPSPTSPGTHCPPSLPPTPGQPPSAPCLKPEWVPSQPRGTPWGARCHEDTPRSHAFHRVGTSRAALGHHLPERAGGTRSTGGPGATSAGPFGRRQWRFVPR